MTPAKVAALRVVVSVIIGTVLMFQFDRVVVVPEGLRMIEDLPALGPLHEGWRQEGAVGTLQHLGATGLALGAGVAAWLEYVLLRRTVRRRIGPTVIGGGRLRRLLLPLAALTVVALGARPVVAGLHPMLAGAIAVTAAATAYLVVARMTGVAEVQDVGRLVNRIRGR